MSANAIKDQRTSVFFIKYLPQSSVSHDYLNLYVSELRRLESLNSWAWRELQNSLEIRPDCLVPPENYWTGIISGPVNTHIKY